MSENLQHKGWDQMKQLLDKQMPSPSLLHRYKGLAFLLLLFVVSGSVLLVYWSQQKERDPESTAMDVALTHDENLKLHLDKGILQEDGFENIDQSGGVRSNGIALSKNDSQNKLAAGVASSTSSPLTRKSADEHRLALDLMSPNDKGADAWLESSDDFKEAPTSLTSNVSQDLSPEQKAALSNGDVSTIITNDFVVFDDNDLVDRQEAGDKIGLDDPERVVMKSTISLIGPWYAGLDTRLSTQASPGYMLDVQVGKTLSLIPSLWVSVGAGASMHQMSQGRGTIALHDGSNAFSANTSPEEIFGLLPGETELALLDVERSWSFFQELTANVRLGAGFFAGLGMQSAYRFSIARNELSQMGVTINGDPSMRQFTVEEMEQLFDFYNRWDFRPLIVMGYQMGNTMIQASYMHGTRSYTRYPVEAAPAWMSRSIGIGIKQLF